MGDQYFHNIMLHWTLGQFLLIPNALFVFLIASDTEVAEHTKVPMMTSQSGYSLARDHHSGQYKGILF